MSSVFMSMYARPIQRAAFARQAFAHSPLNARFSSLGSSVLQQTRSSFYRSRIPHGPAIMARSVPKKPVVSPFWRAAGVAVVGLGLSAASRPNVYCDAGTLRLFCRIDFTMQILTNLCSPCSCLPRDGAAPSSPWIFYQRLRTFFRHRVRTVRRHLYQERCQSVCICPRWYFCSSTGLLILCSRLHWLTSCRSISGQTRSPVSTGIALRLALRTSSTLGRLIL